MATKNIDFMMAYVKEYLDGKKDRWEFDLDFNHELMKRWSKMRREDSEYADVFYEWISEDGVDAGANLSDSEYKKLIRLQYKEVKSIAASGFFQ